MSAHGVGRAGRWAVSLSAALYRALVAVRYDRELRRRFGPDMEELFRALLAEEVRRGTLRGLAAGWLRVAGDLMNRPPPRRPDRQEEPRRRARWLPAAVDDVRHALRSLRREPRFAALVVVVPAVGIALTVAVFAVVHAYLLRPLPYPASDRLVSVRNAAAAELSWDELDAVFELGVSWDLDVFSMIGDGEPELTFGAWVTPTFQEVYDVRPALGRRFLPDEGRPGSARVALISDRLWRERYGSDPGIVGHSFSAYMSDRPDEAESFTIVGVLPRDFWYLNRFTDVLVPVVEPRTIYTGRLRAGVPVAHARDMLTAFARRRAPGLPADFAVEVIPLHELYVADVKPPLLVMQAAVLLVLLIACANTAVLLLVRSAGRERELGVRRALGAPAGRLARQLIAEGLVLASLAGVTGVLLAAVGVDAVAGVIEARIGRGVPGGPGALGIDATVLAAAAGLCAVIGMIFGLVPLAMSGRGPLSAVLGEVSRGGTDSRGRRRLRGAMVAAEVALSLALLTGAGLMVRSAVHLQREDLGFDPDRVEVGEVGIRQASYPETEDRIAFFDRLIGGVRALPAVESAALVSSAPFTTVFGSSPFAAEEPRNGARRTEAVGYVVGEGYFETMGIALVRGRDFSRADVAGGEPVGIISEALAGRLWPGLDPIGRRFRSVPDEAGMMQDQPGPWLRVIGLVGDARRDLGGVPPGDVYVTQRQQGRLWLEVVARARPGAGSVLPAIEAVVHQLDPQVPLSSPAVLEERVGEAMAPTRFLAALLSGFSGFALILAVFGLYGVVAYAARQRRRDVAIRMALGASRSEVAGLFLRQGMSMVLAGIALGAGGGYLLGDALAGQLHGVTAGDPLTHVGLALLLLLTAVAAVWIPARHAAATEPMRILREE